ncbi:GATA transcription factor 4-like [Diospyros lotus]|uniref:GATA transcription factor 4-like n=1 Tax=Diospyros lotus TaxID=55363 RepID=UPI002254254B|nr:GATA transcription factor 4-like [Diospyros lotus]
MDVCGVSAPDCFRIDDLLDFSNDELFPASTATAAAATDSDLCHHHQLSPDNNCTSGSHQYFSSIAPCPDQSTDFTDHLCVPNDDVAELEWLSHFVDDSFTYFPADEFPGIENRTSETSSHGRSRSKRSKAVSKNNGWASSTESDATIIQKTKANAAIARKRESSWSSSGITEDSRSPSETSEAVPRRCTHCSSEKTPQWRTGPLGPKTLCNACGVRYKSGRLVPEYRPAASPTFVLTQHSNSHRKVMELRRQKETLRQQQQQPQEEQHRQMFHHHHNFEVC